MGSWLRRNISFPWLLATICMVAVIWGNSLVPGAGSSSLSLSVLHAVKSFLGSLGIPSAWVTNFLIRKAAHMTEYAVLAVLAYHALNAPGTVSWTCVVRSLALCALVAAFDETIQLSVAGRCGAVTDVLIDSVGACLGTMIVAGLARVRERSAR